MKLGGIPLRPSQMGVSPLKEKKNPLKEKFKAFQKSAVSLIKKSIPLSFKNWGKNRDFVFIKTTNPKGELTEKIFHINDFSKKFFLTIKEARQLKKDETKLNHFYNHFSHSLENYQTSFHNFLHSNPSTKITAEMLMKMTTTAFVTLKENQSAFFQIGSIHSQQSILFMKCEGKIDILFKAKRLGTGSFGTAVLFKHIMTNLEQSVLKFNNLTKDKSRSQKGREEINNEHYSLNYLHEGGKKIGIQDPPRRLTTIIEGDRDAVMNEYGSVQQKAASSEVHFGFEVGHIGSAYEGNTAELIFKLRDNPKLLGKKDYVDLIYQLFTGLSTIHSKKIFHGDIKPFNLFYRKNKGNFDFHIADFGGAQKLEITSDSLFERGTHTKNYVQKKDNRLMRMIKDLRRTENYPRTKCNRLIRKILFAGDVYATARSIYEIVFHGFFEGTIDEKSISQCNKKLEKLQVPKTLIQLLTRAMDSDYDKRPTAREFAKAFSKLKK